MNPFRQYTGIFSGVVVILLILCGCVGWGQRMETPRITLSNFIVQEIKLFESVFNIEIRVFNTNDIPLDIKGLDCDLEFNGKRLATGVSSAQIHIPPYETILVPMTLYSSVLGVVSVLRGLSKNEKLEYKLTGRLRLGKGTIPSLLPFESQGELPLEELMFPNTG